MNKNKESTENNKENDQLKGSWWQVQNWKWRNSEDGGNKNSKKMKEK